MIAANIPFLGVIGQTLELAALLFATMGCAVAFRAGVIKSLRLYNRAKYLAWAFAGSVIAANFTMIVALFQRDFTISYVAEVGSRSTPTFFVIPSLWSSLNGSILLWGGVLGLYTIGLTVVSGNKHREYMPYTLGVLLAISVFFTWLIAGVANPFAPTIGAIPYDGPGPNPLLQNHLLMAFHPPALYLGYVGMAVPFSMVSGALFAGKLEQSWIKPLRLWALVPWIPLTVGIVMGGWWSYEVLGWGGYWAWDPVENASLLPWLTATAFLHSAMLLERRGLARNWTVVLCMSSFLLTLVGTFMTRSGIFNSVHSFTQSEIGPIFLVFIGIVSTFCIVLLAFRLSLLSGEELQQGPLRKKNSFNNPIVAGVAWLLGGSEERVHGYSREFAIILQNLALTALTFVVLLGTTYPLIMEAIPDFLARFGELTGTMDWAAHIIANNNWRVSVGEPYFDQLTLPLGTLIVFLMGVGPALPWGRGRTLMHMMAPAMAGLVLVAMSAAWGFAKPGTLLAMWVCGFAMLANIREFTTPVLQRMRAKKENPITAARTVTLRAHRRFGGHLAHLGVVVAVLSIALSKGYKLQDDFVFEPGVSQTYQGYTITYIGSEIREEPHRDSQVAMFTLHKEGSLLDHPEPKLNTYMVQVMGRNGIVQRTPRMREPIGTPYVYSTIQGDVYFSLMQIPEDGTWASARIMWMPAVPWLWWSMGLIAFGASICLIPPPTSKKKEDAQAPKKQRATA